MDDWWKQFTQTGSVADYLKYRENQKQELTNADNRQGLNHQGTDRRGE